MASSPLFSLPRELRDQIYTYALYNGDGLLYQMCSHGVERLYKSAKKSGTMPSWFRRMKRRRKCTSYTRENNQLQYVCKCLRHETNSLNLLRDYLIFQDNANDDALQQCMSLLYRCPKVQQVAIKCSLKSFQSNYDRHGFSAITRYCQMNPNFQARIYVPYWSQADPNFVLIGLHFLATLRASTPQVRQFVQSILGSYQLNSTLAPIPNNIRLFPKEERFCQQIFQQKYRNSSMTLPIERDLQAEVLKQIESWFRYGL